MIRLFYRKRFTRYINKEFERSIENKKCWLTLLLLKIKIKCVFNRMVKRYENYAEKIVNKLGRFEEIIEPYFYISMTAVTNYMVFEEDKYILSQIKLIKKAIYRFKVNK